MWERRLYGKTQSVQWNTVYTAETSLYRRVLSVQEEYCLYRKSIVLIQEWCLYT